MGVDMTSPLVLIFRRVIQTAVAADHRPAAEKFQPFLSREIIGADLQKGPQKGLAMGCYFHYKGSQKRKAFSIYCIGH
jgi:nucleoside-specific outer membrane channel protein Tsx